MIRKVALAIVSTSLMLSAVLAVPSLVKGPDLVKSPDRGNAASLVK